MKEATCSSEVEAERVVKMGHGPMLPHVQVSQYSKKGGKSLQFTSLAKIELPYSRFHSLNTTLP